jgi:hypothetical protein
VVLRQAGLQELPGVAVDAAPIGELGAALLVVDQAVLGLLVGDAFDAA